MKQTSILYRENIHFLSNKNLFVTEHSIPTQFYLHCSILKKRNSQPDHYYYTISVHYYTITALLLYYYYIIKK
jgi:hypothetical protein